MQVDNTMSYATHALANHMAGMAAQIGILQQKVDELSQANQILKAQLKQKEGDANDTAKPDTDNGQTDEQPAEAAPAAK
jgi:TolA-binding protein